MSLLLALYLLLPALPHFLLAFCHFLMLLQSLPILLPLPLPFSLQVQGKPPSLPQLRTAPQHLPNHLLLLHWLDVHCLYRRWW